MFKDTHLFSPAAQSYLDKGYYTDAIDGTKEFYTFGIQKRIDACMGMK